MASSEDFPELTLSVIGEQVAQAARDGRLIARAYLITPEAAVQVLAEHAGISRTDMGGSLLDRLSGDGDSPDEVARKFRDRLRLCLVFFSRDGRLLDGADYLQAIARAGIPATLVISFGVDPGLRDEIGRGARCPRGELGRLTRAPGASGEQPGKEQEGKRR
jgi:hypothetical protein